MSAPLPHAFYRQDAVTVARALIGTVLQRQFRGRILRARIVETEAYVGPHDLACHAAKGRTKRTEVMFGPPGRAYVYLIYGMYQMLNIVTGDHGDAQAVLLRAAEPLDHWTANLTGPGRLARALHITPALNGEDLTTSQKLFVLDSPTTNLLIARTPRVGVNYAGDWTHRPLRF